MKKILIISMLLMTGDIFGQGIDAELYQYNYSFVHPAFAGSEGQRISLLANTERYNANFGNGADNTMVLVAYENHFKKINSGIAVTGYSERMASSSLSSLAFSYNYKFALGTSSELLTSARVKRHFYSVSSDYYRQIDPSDPLLSPNFSASNWAADLGVLLRVKESYFGFVANDVLHTDNTIDVIASPSRPGENYAGIVGTSFAISEHLASEHSLYIPFDDAGYRIDLNNTLTINDLFLAGLSLERSHGKFFLRGNAGLKVKDYGEVVFLFYSGKRDHFGPSGFRGEVLMGFTF